MENRLYNIVLTTAEDIVAVTDSVLAKNSNCTIQYISDFADLTIDQARNALHMAIEFGLIVYDEETQHYSGHSTLARLLITSKNDEHKAAVMRFILEQYQPFTEFIARFAYSDSIDIAAREIKAIHNMSTNQRDIKNTIVSIATYAKAIKSEGANLYSLNNDGVSFYNYLGEQLNNKNIDELVIRKKLGDEICSFLDSDNVLMPLIDAFSKTKGDNLDVKSCILHAGNAFESFLNQYAIKHGVPLVGKNGIIQKSNALSQVLSKKHRGMIEYVGQVRNAAEHGSDPEEGNQMWGISEDTATTFPFIICTLIKNILCRDNGEIIV